MRMDDINPLDHFVIHGGRYMERHGDSGESGGRKAKIGA